MCVADGRVVSIYVSPVAGSPMRPRDEVQAVPRRGLEGDRYFDGVGVFSKRPKPGREVTEVTFIEAEVIEHLRRDLGIEVEAADSRRNIVTRGVSLNELVGSEFQVGPVRLVGAGLCEPCVSLVKSPENKHLLRGLVHKGGLRARILTSGTIAVGDSVAAVSASDRRLAPAVSPHVHRIESTVVQRLEDHRHNRLRGDAVTEMLDPVTRIHVEKAAEALQDEFAGTFSRETIARFLAESVDLLGESKINVFVPVLAHRFARERLKALGQTDGLITKEQPEVLFVCVQNAGRSQMAAGLVTLRSGGLVGVRSAGSDPGEIVNPLAAQALAELGVDLGEAFPKPLTDEVVRAADIVVTMGCGDACPIYPGKRYEDWEVGDPAEASSLDEVRAIRDDIDRRIQQLLSELGAPITS